MSNSNRRTRRQVLAAAAGAALAASSPASGDTETVVYPDRSRPFGAPDKDRLVGRILRFPATTTLELETHDGIRVVEFAQDAIIFVDGPADVVELSVGEQVLVEGMARREQFVAEALAPLYRPVESQVRRRDGRRLETSAGTIRLEGTVFEDMGVVGPVPDGMIAIGQRVAVLARVEPRSGDLLALRLYEPQD